MSYTIQATPSSMASVQGDLIYTVAYPEHTANPVTYPNYKFVADVYVGAVQVARLKAVPNPVTKIGIFNIGQIIRNYITTTFNATAASFVAQQYGLGEFNIGVTVKFGEEYSYTTYSNLLVDSERFYFNNYNGRMFGTLTSLTGLTNKPLTDRPTTTPVECDSTFNFVPFFGTSSGTVAVQIKTYDYSNSLVSTVNTTPAVTIPNNLLVFNCSKDGINSITPGTVNDSIKYYTVQWAGGTVYRFDITCECNFERFAVHFLNKYGGFESKVFDKVSRKTIAIDKKDFGKLPYTVDSSGVVSYSNSNNVYNESRATYSSQYKEKLTLNSDFLTDEEYTWLQELVLSPLVYLQQEGYFFPVAIVENNYEVKKYINDGELSNLTISIEFGEQLNAQYR